MSEDEGEKEIVRSARITRHRDGTPVGTGIHLTATDLLQLGIDPVDTDVVDIRIQDGSLHMIPDDGKPVIIERGAPDAKKEEWQEAKAVYDSG
ncbi:hypothetical protein ACODNH_07120 [Haloarcula sp. NS06]|uniref:hypothetical protein n=1 Tax=Haloarcula sp. NS06 TaxID=3409688 RepID=UPI003DA71394